jgi:CRP-like cAMP-binding protein
MTRDITSNLDAVPLLASLTQGERDQLARQCRFKRYSVGEHIIDGQSDSRDVYFIVEGTVRVVNYSLSGREVTLDDVSSGGYFGELAAIDGGRRSAFVMPQGGDAVAASMPHTVFLNLLASKPALALHIMQRLAQMVRQSSERIMDLSTLGANNRIHAELLRQARAASTTGRTAVITPIPIHGDIASRVSTTRETVARVLNDLARSRIVERKKDALIVHDIDQLATMVDDVRGG